MPKENPSIATEELRPKSHMTVEKKMTNCPKCQKPILNGGVFTSHAKFTMRCPWCQATLEIHVQPKIITEVVKLGNGESLKPPGTGNLEEDSLSLQTPEEIEGLFGRSKAQGFRLVGYLYPEKRE